MPAGKAVIVGGSFPLPDLPNCSCEWLLDRDRKTHALPLLDEERAALLARVNRALCIYVGRVNYVDVPTYTQTDKSIGKIVLAAKRLLAAHKAKKQEQVIAWGVKLAERMTGMGAQAMQVMTGKFIARSRGKVSGDAIQDFLESRWAITGDDWLVMVKTIAAIGIKARPIKGFRDPHLPDLVMELAEVWSRIAGRTPLPTSVSKNSNEKSYLFAEWVQEVVREANKALPMDGPPGLPKFRRVALPKEGAIFDIAVLLHHSNKN